MTTYTHRTLGAKRLSFTTKAYVRATGHAPRGTGMWAFCRTHTETAFEDDLVGEPEFYSGTLAEAKAALKADGGTGLWAVLG